MTERGFVDTNVLVYAAHGGEAAKCERARNLLSSLASDGVTVISAQVMGEFYTVMTGKLRSDTELIRLMMQRFAAWETVSVDATLVTAAIDCAQAHQLSYWDALIIVAAERARCRVLYSEDLNAGQTVRGVRIVNPFAE